MLSPVTILGSGIHRQILATPRRSPAGATRILQDWDALLGQVAASHGLDDALDRIALKSEPTLRWEAMVLASVCRHGHQHAAYIEERELRKRVVKLLSDAERTARPHVLEHRVRELSASLGRHVVSLNMDGLLPALLGEGETLESRGWPGIKTSGGVFWFPHGTTRKPQSITLGIRDYGRLAPSWLALINQFKQSERSRLAGQMGLQAARGFRSACKSVDALKETSLQSLVGHLMLAPLILFGAGMGTAEWGLWWLLNQRARNLARVPASQRPETRIVVKATDKRRALFETGVAGLRPIVVRDWNQGWQGLIDWLREHSHEPTFPLGSAAPKGATGR